MSSLPPTNRASVPKIFTSKYGVPDQIRTGVTWAKTRCPKPLDDRNKTLHRYYKTGVNNESRTRVSGVKFQRPCPLDDIDNETGVLWENRTPLFLREGQATQPFVLQDKTWCRRVVSNHLYGFSDHH